MVNGVTLTEATKRHNLFCFAIFHSWWRGFVVGGDMGKEATQPEATKKKTNIFDSGASTLGCEASRAVSKQVTLYRDRKPPKETIIFGPRTSTFGGEAWWSLLKRVTK